MLIVDLYLVWGPNQSFVPVTAPSVNHRPQSVLDFSWLFYLFFCLHNHNQLSLIKVVIHNFSEKLTESFHQKCQKSLTHWSFLTSHSWLVSFKKISVKIFVCFFLLFSSSSCSFNWFCCCSSNSLSCSKTLVGGRNSSYFICKRNWKKTKTKRSWKWTWFIT